MNRQSQELFEIPFSHETDHQFVASEMISNLLLINAVNDRRLDKAGVYRIAWRQGGKNHVYDGKAGGGTQTVRQRLRNHLWCLTHLGVDPTQYRVSVQLRQAGNPTRPSKLNQQGKEHLRNQERKRISESFRRAAQGKVISTNKQKESEFLFEAPVSMQEIVHESGGTAATAWNCRAEGVPCPELYYEWFNPKGVCQLTNCRKAKTYKEPWGISPGTCTYRCPQGSTCSGPMFGKSWAAFVPFVLCD
jgi:hypothetical protein